MTELDKAKIALRKLMAMSKTANGNATSEGSKEQASQALRQLFRRNGAAKDDAGEAGEIDVKLATLLDRVLKPTGASSSSSSKGPMPVTKPAMETPEELAEKMGPEPYRKPLPDIPKRRLVLPEEGGLSAPMKVKVKEARKALQKKDQTVTQLTLSLKQCRKQVWDLQCEANAADMKVARMLQKREGELPEEYREELERLKDKEEEIADQLSTARANAQRWASVAKRQDAMLQQEREEQRGDAHTILAKHPAGEVFWTFGSDSDSEEASPARRRDGPTEVTRDGSSDEDSYRPMAKGKAKAPSYSSDSASSGDDSIDLPGTGPVGSSGPSGPSAKAKAVPAVPIVSAHDADDVSEISEDIPESSRSV